MTKKKLNISLEHSKMRGPMEETLSNESNTYFDAAYISIRTHIVRNYSIKSG